LCLEEAHEEVVMTDMTTRGAGPAERAQHAGGDPTIAALTGRVDVRFADTTLIDLAAGGTPVDLEFAYTLSAMAKLVLTAHEVYLPKPKLAVEGPGRRPGELRSPGREERRRRADAHRHAHQRPERNRIRMMYKVPLRLALSSVDVRL
jgi:hypothetical protein